MHKFLQHLIIIINIVFCVSSLGQTIPSNVRFDHPKFMSINESFNASVLFRFDEITNDKIEITFYKLPEIIVNSAVLSNSKNERDLDVKISEVDPNKLTIKLNEHDLDYKNNLPHQILLKCTVLEPIKINRDLFKLVNSEDDNQELLSSNFIEENENYKAQFYKKQQTAGKNLVLSNNSFLAIKLKNKEELENLLIEFWMNAEKSSKSIFNLIEPLSNDTIISFSKNEYGFITFSADDGEIARNDVYLGDNDWNYFSIKIFSTINYLKLEVYINSTLSYTKMHESMANIQNANVVFSNDENSIKLDRLKIWEYNNNIELAEKNKHFLVYEADSSNIIYQTNFDNSAEFIEPYNSENLDIIYENIQLKNSDAPIFSKAPKLNVNIGSSYNSIVWYVQEYSLAKEFIIEKSESNGDFQPVYRTFADNDPLRIYYFTDEIAEENVVLYYRVRQINIDDSEVFSPEIKIGNKKATEFKLSQNYPNPFNPFTNIYVEVLIPSEYEVNVYDLVGNKIKQLNDGFLSDGLHTFEFDGSQLPSGIYFYEVISPKTQIVKKMILAK